MKTAPDGRHPTDEGKADRKPDAPHSNGEETTAADERDVVFRVSLPDVDEPAGSLEDFYRETLRDLLQVVRFSFRGQPVLVDAFAFLNRPEREIRILREDDHGAG